MLFPEIINVELTNACNLACRFCDHPQLKKRMKIANMPENILVKVLSDIGDRKIYELGLVGLGEPLLNKQLEQNLEIIRKHQEKFQRISLNTNAVLLDGQKTDLIYRSPINFVTISLNAGTKESYHNMMGRDHFSDVIDNIKAFITAGRHRRQKLQIRVQVMQQDAENFNKVLDLFKAFPDDNVNIFLRKEYNKPVYKAEEIIGPAERYPCWSIYSRIYIDVMGNLYPCTIGNDSYREASSLWIGNIMKQSVGEIFNSPVAEDARRRAEEGDFPFTECKACNIWHILPNNFSLINNKWCVTRQESRSAELKD